MPRAVLDSKLVALVEAGATLNAEQQALVDAVKAASEAEAAEAAKAAVDAKAAADAKAALEAEAAAATAAAAAAAAAQPAAKSELVTYLERQLAGLKAELATATAALTAATVELADIKPSFAALVGIASDSINTMTVGLGGRKVELSGLSGKEIVVKHAATRVDFEKNFPVGGVAATAATDKEVTAENVVTSEELARRRMFAIPAAKK